MIKIGYILVSLGVFFDLFGALALLRFREVYSRLLASTKCVTLGTCLIMLGIFFICGANATGIKALLCAAFVLLTSPVTAHALSRAESARRAREKQE